MRKVSLIRGLGLFLVLLIACGELPDTKLMDKAAAYEKDERFQAAARTYEKLGETYPTSQLAPEALYKAGLIYANALKDYEKGVGLLRKVEKQYPDARNAAQCNFMIGFIYANSVNDTSKAREAYNQFLNKYPDNELVPSVKWELDHLGKDISEIPELKKIEEQPSSTNN
ncbi:tetratricopeptide repeat protein [bacterium]|nr:tetratricopeptide repeat protein [bacterium]